MLQEAASAGKPDGLALLDFQMPEMDGLELARTIKSDLLIQPTVWSCFFECITEAMGMMPVQSGPAETMIPPLGRFSIHRQKKILLADDNIINQKVGLAQLQKLGYAAKAVGTGLEVIAALEQVSYAVMLMECQMPGMDGYETTQAIRQREQGLNGGPWKAPVHIIAMTAHAMQGDRENACPLG